MQKAIITLIIVVLIGIGGYFGYQAITGGSENMNQDQMSDEMDDMTNGSDTDDQMSDEEQMDESESILGQSAGGFDVTAYHYGDGDTELLFVGGIHGGYSWNTVLVAYELMDYLEANPDVVPENVRVTVVPVMNPDGLNEVVGTTGRFSASEVPSSQEATVPGRFNANEVDLNRNFACDWQSSATWQSRTVDGGNAEFSEPESQAIRNYVEANNPDGVVVWYSAVGGVFASNCHEGVLPETLTLTNLYADASGYQAYEEFNFYEITGDMVNWLAREEIPAISVLLTTHEDVEWNMNRAGIEALLEYYAN